MSYVFLFYIFLSFVIASGGAFVLFSGGRTVSAIAYLVGAIAIEVFFGLRWFKADGTTTKEVGSWPLSINVCPDFLSLYTNVDGSGNKISYCVDNIGVSPTGIKRWTSTSTPGTDNVFNLSTNITGDPRVKALCAEAKAKGVNWEGVWDGTVCLGGVPPLP